MLVGKREWAQPVWSNKRQYVRRWGSTDSRQCCGPFSAPQGQEQERRQLRKQRTQARKWTKRTICSRVSGKISHRTHSHSNSFFFFSIPRQGCIFFFFFYNFVFGFKIQKWRAHDRSIVLNAIKTGDARHLLCLISRCDSWLRGSAVQLVLFRHFDATTWIPERPVIT